MWLEVFEGKWGYSHEGPSCLAAPTSLEVLAVPGGRRAYSQSFILTCSTQMVSFYTRSNALYYISSGPWRIQVSTVGLKVPSCQCQVDQSHSSESSEAAGQESTWPLDITGHFLHSSRLLCGFISHELPSFLLIIKKRWGKTVCVCGELAATLIFKIWILM